MTLQEVLMKVASGMDERGEIDLIRIEDDLRAADLSPEAITEQLAAYSELLQESKRQSLKELEEFITHEFSRVH